MSQKPSLEVQRQWLDVRCATIGTPQHEGSLKVFLHSFLSSPLPQSDSVFKQLFGSGKELASQVAKALVHRAQRILKAPPPAAVGLTVDGLVEVLLKALVFLIQQDQATSPHVALLIATHEQIGDHNIVALLILLHHQLMQVVRDGGQSLTGFAEGMTVDLLYLKVIRAVLVCPKRELVKRSRTEADLPKALEGMASTLPITYHHPYEGSSCTSQLALEIFQLQLASSTATEAMELVCRILEGALSTPLQHSGDPPTHPASQFTSLVCLVEGIVAAKSRIGFAARETVSFSALTSAVLLLEPGVKEPVPLCQRLVKCLHIMTITPRAPPPASPSPPPLEKKRSALMKLVPGSFSQLQQKLMGTFFSDSGPTAGPAIGCPEATMCLADLFLRTTSTSAVPTYAEDLFTLLSLAGTDEMLPRSVLASCITKVASLSTQKLGFVLGYLHRFGAEHDVGGLVESLIDALKAGLLTSATQRSIVLDFFVAYCSSTPQRAVEVLRGGLLTVLTAQMSELLDGPEKSTVMLVEKLSILSKVLVTSPSSAPYLECDGVPLSVLRLVLRTRANGLVQVSVILRDVFTNFVAKTGRFYSVLVAETARFSDTSPWKPETTALLTVLVATLQSGKYLEEAVRENCVELCCAMLHDIDSSTHTLPDQYCLGCSLGFLLPLVEYSEVWGLFDSAVGTMARSPRNTQFLIDLCCGFLRSPQVVTACGAFFDSQDDGVFAAVHDGGEVCGRYSIPSHPFCELEHPLKTLLLWTDQSLESVEEDAEGLVTAVERLLLHTEVKVPNTYVCSLITRCGRLKLLSCARDVTGDEFTALLFAEDDSLAAIAARQHAWLAALQLKDGVSAENRYRVEFGDAGGASGTVMCTGEPWPSLDGFTTAMWVRWDLTANADRTDRRAILWQLQWTSNGVGFVVTFSVNPTQKRCYYTVQEGSNEARSTEVPFIPRRTWTHVVVNHSRAKLFSSFLKVYYDGLLVHSVPCSYPAAGLQAAAAVTNVLPLPSRSEVQCTIASPKERPNGRLVFAFTSFLLFNSSLQANDVLSLFCRGPQLRGGSWGTSGSYDASLMSPFLSEEVLRGLLVRYVSGTQNELTKSHTLTLTSPPDRELLRLHVRSMALAEAPLAYLNNKQWAFLNCSAAAASPFLLYGRYTPPEQGVCNEVDALLAHGAMYEWIRWMDAIAAAADCPATVEEASSVARRFLEILAEANKQAELSSVAWRRFFSRLTGLARRFPGVYLRDEASLRSLLSLSVRVIGHCGVPARVVYFTTPLEHIFFDWRLLSNLPSHTLNTLLDIVEELVDPSNPLCAFNALRFRAADFVNGFVFGLAREYVDSPALHRGVRIVTSFLLALVHDEHVFNGVCTLCAVSVPFTDAATSGSHLASKLLPCAVDYVTLVRNLLLKSLNDVWDRLDDVTRRTYVKTLGGVLPPCWFTVLTSSASHPVSVCLALRLFVILFLHNDEFREQYKDGPGLCFTESLLSHACQREVVEVVFHGFTGNVWRLTEQRTPLPTLAANGGTATAPLLLLTLRLLQRQSQVIVRDDGVPWGITPTNCAAYFKAAATPPPAVPTPARKLRRAVWAVLCCVRVARRLQQSVVVPLFISPTSPSNCSAAVNDRDLRGEMKSTICEVLDWLASRYRQHKSVRHALYRSKHVTNPIDLVMWPLLSSLRLEEEVAEEVHPDGGDVLPSTGATPTAAAPAPELAESGGASNTNLSQPSTVNAGESASTTAAAMAADDSGDDEDEEWEMLPAVVSVHSRSLGLDRLAPRPGLEGVYDSCRSLFLVHATAKVDAAELLQLARGRTKLSKFVLSLHRILSAEVRGVGNESNDWRTAFLCGVWLKAAEQSVDAAPGLASSTIVRNVLSLAKFVLDRLVSGSAAPPAAIAGFYRFLLARLDDNVEVIKTGRTCLFEWFMYCTNSSFHRFLPDKVARVIDMIYSCQDVLLASPMPTGDLLTGVLVRFLELSHAFVNGVTDSDDAPAGRKLGALWCTVLKANRNAPLLTSILSDSTRGIDLLHGGLDLVLPPVSSNERFLQWLRASRTEVWRVAQNTPTSFQYVLAEGGRYERFAVKSVYLYQQQEGALARQAIEQRKTTEASWYRLLDTTTFVDRGIIDDCRWGLPGNCVMLRRRSELHELRQWFLRSDGVVGLKEYYNDEKVDDLASEPLSHYIRYPPPVCAPLRVAFSEAAPSAPSGLRPNAAMILSRITGPTAEDAVRWIGNVYYVVGNESLVCVVVVTGNEVCLVSCSEVTRKGDFFIAHVRRHAATQKSLQRSTFMQDTLRRFMPRQSSGAGGGSSTNTAAAFRFSQYYRQLQTESLQGASALVWRFSVGNISAIHQRLFQHMPAALELQLESGEQFFIVVLDEDLSMSKAARDRLQHVLEERAPQARVETTASKRTQLQQCTRRWMQGELSNRVYLDTINDAASRTVADLGQYPVVPWVLQDYRSGRLDLADVAVYRDLTRPVGALNAVKAAQLQERYREWISDSEPPFHYGTHYSTSAIVLYFLVRLQPYTKRSIRFQGGRLDIADRLFHSVAEAWESSSGPGSGDVKELIPEFFTLSDFLRNRNDTPLGTRRDGVALGDVELPPWCHGNPALFTHLHIMALESDVVSAHLNDWIDLVFGFKQRGEEAVKAVNVFNHLSYQDGVERAIDHAASEEDRMSVVASADNFGQTPPQLFVRGAHPRRLPPGTVQTLEQYWNENVRGSYRHPFPTSVCIGAVGAPVESVHFVDDVFLGCSADYALTTGKPQQVFAYHERVGGIRCTLLKSNRLVCELPPIEIFGCGAFRCFSVTPTGNLLCVGTHTGKVLVFSRGGIRYPFTISSVLHPPSPKPNSVAALRLFSDGRLFVMHEHDSVVTGWHASCISTVFCFHLEAAAPNDQSPMEKVVQLEQYSVFAAVKRFTVVFFTGQGILLNTVDIRPLLQAFIAADRSPNPLNVEPVDHASAGITAMAVLDTDGWSRQSLLLLGHQNGLLTFWFIEPACTSDSPDELFSMRLCHSFVFSCAVTSILPLPFAYTVGVGLEDGSIAKLNIPAPNEEEA